MRSSSAATSLRAVLRGSGQLQQTTAPHTTTCWCALWCAGAEHIDPSKAREVWLAGTEQHAYWSEPDMNNLVAGTLFKAHAHW